nr:Chain C, C-terminal hexapeptide from Guanylate kinase-associated protein [synthetic construct]1Q3P_D Chain D, C-terminal hexapeptide from Guanylate kinase-associated protein [synthetic construct]
EAQTRL